MEPISHPGGAVPTKVEGGGSSGRTLEGAHQEAFHKDSDLVKHIRKTYFKVHLPVIKREVTHDLANVFKEFAEIAGLLDTKIHQVQDQWQGKKELSTANPHG